MPGPQHQSECVESVDCAVLTVSDTRTLETDASGALIVERLSAAGHRVVRRELVPDDPERVRALVRDWAGNRRCQAILVTGGTGIADRDNTYEAVAELLVKRLDGFGELFRMLSHREIGPAAMLSRAVAGVCGSTIVFVMPGSSAAVRLAMDELIVPELGHIAALLHW